MPHWLGTLAATSVRKPSQHPDQNPDAAVARRAGGGGAAGDRVRGGQRPLRAGPTGPRLRDAALGGGADPAEGPLHVRACVEIQSCKGCWNRCFQRLKATVCCFPIAFDV